MLSVEKKNTLLFPKGNVLKRCSRWGEWLCLEPLCLKVLQIVMKVVIAKLLPVLLLFLFFYFNFLQFESGLCLTFIPFHLCVCSVDLSFPFGGKDKLWNLQNNLDMLLFLEQKQKTGSDGEFFVTLFKLGFQFKRMWFFSHHLMNLLLQMLTFYY